VTKRPYLDVDTLSESQVAARSGSKS